MTESVKVWKSPEDLPRVIGRGLCDISSRGISWGISVMSCVFRTGCPELCVIRFKYLAALTRRTTVTAVGTGLPNHCLHRANWFHFLNPSISSYLCCVLVYICLKTLTKDFLYFLSLISSVCLSYPVFTLSVLCACFHFFMKTMLMLCYVYFWVLIPLQVVLHLGISSLWNSSVKNS